MGLVVSVRRVLGPREAPFEAEDEDFWLPVGDVEDIDAVPA